MTAFADTSWADIDALRTAVMAGGAATVAAAAQAFVEAFAAKFSSIVLARMFLVVPLDSLPPVEHAVAVAAANGDARLRPTSRVLSLLGTTGREPAWCDRAQSRGHLAIPLLDSAHVQGIPMIARLLADLEVDFRGLDDGRAIASQPMLGGHNGKFSIADAQTARDTSGRWLVPARDFVSTYDVRSVFGMGGSYFDGTLAVAVLFTSEVVDTLVSDRFPSLISNFKMATTDLRLAGRVYA